MCPLIPAYKEGCEGPQCSMHHGLCVHAYDTEAHTWADMGGHTPEPRCVHTRVPALQETSASAPGPLQKPA